MRALIAKEKGSDDLWDLKQVRGGRFVNFPGLQPADPVLDDVQPADRVLGAELVELLHIALVETEVQLERAPPDPPHAPEFELSDLMGAHRTASGPARAADESEHDRHRGAHQKQHEENLRDTGGTCRYA